MNEEKVRGLNIARLQNHEQFGFITEFKMELQRSNIGPLLPFVDQLTPLVAEEDRALEWIRRSEHTRQLAELDTACDNCYRGLIKTVHAASQPRNRRTRCGRSAGNPVADIRQFHGREL